MDSNETPKPLDYRAILEALEAQRAALDRAIAEMRVVASASGSFVPAEGNGNAPQGSGVLSPSDVPAGAFHGKSIPEAAVLYLRLVKQKQKSADIAIALKRGGILSEAKPERFNNQVHSILDRASGKEGGDLVKLQGAYWALREWLPAGVRASVGSGASNGKKKKKGKGKKRATGIAAPGKPAEKTKAVPPEAESDGYRSPNPDSTEGRILAAMRKEPARHWMPKEVAEQAGIPRVQTAVFLMGKLAHREFLKKWDDGLYSFSRA